MTRVDKVDSAQSGIQIRGTIPIPIWEKHNEGYTMNRSHLHYRIACQYIHEKKFCDDSEFDHPFDCYYLNNSCHAELRGGHRFYRPSLCTKFIFKSAKSVFNDSTYQYSYHGTSSSNIHSIIQHGLCPGGSEINGTKIKMRYGNRLGWGVYSSACPLYAQLYAPIEEWNGYFVQTILMLRQPETSIADKYSDEGCATTSLLGRTDIWRLYGGILQPNEIQMKTTEYQKIVIQGLLIKIHQKNPINAGGEYDQLEKLLCELSQ
jgi:hypothetical protein